MNDDKVKPKLSSREKLPANTVKIEDPRYEIFYPNISGYCDGIGYYRSYMYNGAFINTFDDEKNPVRYEIIYQDDTHKRIECMRLTLLYPRAKLGGIFTNLPYGIVKKSVPGIGATTLALNQPRDTIIVLPDQKAGLSEIPAGLQQGPYIEPLPLCRKRYSGGELQKSYGRTNPQLYRGEANGYFLT